MSAIPKPVLMGLRLVAAVILVQTLFFKFTASPESVYIFTTLGIEPWGRIGAGVTELAASVLLFVPGMTAVGALLAMGTMGVAILSHLFKLGIVVQGDGGLLFGLAFVVLVCSATLLWAYRRDLPVVGPQLPFLWLIAVLSATATPPRVAAAESASMPINKTFFGSKAIEGYDPVAYFDLKKPTPGKSEFTFEWQGAVWQFATAEHRDRFAAKPEMYAPQYGGYCAFAMADGSKAGIDPNAWSVVDGKLYLNYSHDIAKKWESNRAELIAKADQAWRKLVKGK